LIERENYNPMKIASTIASPNVTISPRKRAFAITSNRLSYRLCQYWILIFTLVYGLFVGLPFLAPILMHSGWTLPAKIIYTIYSFLCHQLPERSFFLFGPKAMYSIGELPRRIGT
jgi:hypothetical protein